MTKPIFAAVFAEQWDGLPPALKAHYANRPHTDDVVTVEGILNISMSPVLKFMSPLIRLLGFLTPWDGAGIACTVHFRSDPKSTAFVFDRRFTFPGHPAYVFRSRLVPKGPHEVIEYMACGVGWRCGYFYEDDRVVLRHKGYILRLFGLDIPLPGATFFMGRGEAFEQATGDGSFRMSMALSGSPLGLRYGYEGEFRVTHMALSDG